jgi:enoyl-CoA hydratase
VVQDVSPTPLETGIKFAEEMAACGPIGIKTTLAFAHLVIDPAEAEALSKTSRQYRTLYRTEDFMEGRNAEAEGRPPIYQGKSSVVAASPEYRA